MEWLEEFLNSEFFTLVVPVFIIVSIFIYAARRAHVKHLERIRKIDEIYNVRSSNLKK
jgi:hypothetical protein